MRHLLRQCDNFCDNATTFATMRQLLRQCDNFCDNATTFAAMRQLLRQCDNFCDNGTTFAAMRQLLRQCNNVGRPKRCRLSHCRNFLKLLSHCRCREEKLSLLCRYNWYKDSTVYRTVIGVYKMCVYCL